MGLTYRRDANEAERCVFLGGEGNTLSSDDDSSSLAVDAGQMARFVKTLKLCSGLVVLTYCT